MSVFSKLEHSKCTSCGKIFIRINDTVCVDCKNKAEAEFLNLKQYLAANPGKNISHVAEKIGISKAKILKYIEEGRVGMTAGLLEEKLLHCARCGVEISKGVMCESCRLIFNDAVHKLKDESDLNKRGTGMHTRKSDDGRTRR